jgi:hypothetical protein
MVNSSNSLNSYKKLNSSFDLIKTPARYDEDLYFVSNKNNSDDSLSYLLQINSNRRNEEFNPAFFSRQNFVENLPFQNIPNEERTIVGTTQIPENPENNKYSLGRNPIYILNEDSDKNFNENSLDGLSFRTIQSNSNNRNSNINQDYPHIQNIGNAPNEPRTSPTVIQIPVNPENNNNLLNISLTSINSSQSINNSDENFNENISDDNSLSSYHTNSNNRNTNFNQTNFPDQNIGNIPNEPRTFATQTCHLFEVKKFLDRKRKRDKNDSDKAKVHDKYEKKNILTKIKKRAYNNHIKFTNKSIDDSSDEEIKKRKIKIQKVDNSKIEVSSKKDNLDLLEMEMKDILSYPLTNNFKTIDKNYNKKAIEFILTRNDEKLISILKINFEDVIRIYAGDLIDKDFDGFKKIEDDILKMENKGVDKKYIEKYKEHAKIYKTIYMEMKEREPRRKN